MNETENLPMVLSGAVDLEAAKKSQLALNNFIASMMKDGLDYGLIPGTKKKSLWQPGAQKLLFFNGLCAKMVCTEKIQDWEKGFFHYEYKAIIFHKASEKVISESFGSANSKEDRYAWRWVNEKKIPRGTDKEDLVSKKNTGDYGDYTTYRVPNPDVYTLPNTLIKMAQKRAMIGGTMLACRASENFTQDVEEEENGQPEAGNAGSAKAKPKPKPANDSNKPDDAISEKQLNRLRAIKKQCGVTDEELKKHLTEHFKYTLDPEGKCHMSWIKRDKSHYEAIVKYVEALADTPPAE